MSNSNSYQGSRDTLQIGDQAVDIYRLSALEKANIANVSSLPFTIKVLVESVLRNYNHKEISQEHIHQIANWSPRATEQSEIPFKPARVLLQDFTGVPALVDLAAMRNAMKKLGGNPQAIEPLIPSELVIDHSIQVDAFANPDALKLNMQFEFKRNRERYEFLKWGQQAFKKFKVIPPGVGIVHQVNLEYFARGVFTEYVDGKLVAYPDSLVGTDSHTTMINGLGIVGWGVGGIEAEAVMLGQPIYMLMPQVVGFKLYGQLPAGATATDLTLVATQMLREKGVVGKFVEYYGPGLSHMTLPDRATLANMSPEYGATMGFFPMDEEAMNYLLRTGRNPAHVDLVRAYLKEQGLFRTDQTPDPEFSDTLELDLSTVEPSLAGPKRPQDRVTLKEMKSSFHSALKAPFDKRGFQLSEPEMSKKTTVALKTGEKSELKHGSVVIAAITSCTNTSNPSVMLAAGLLAQKAVQRGLSVPAHVKTSLAPGSRVVTEYYRETGLDSYLETLGFHTVGYGCTTCIGNSGPLPDIIAQAIKEHDLVAASVLSGNRNFEGRVNPWTKANYLASPPLVVAYAIAGTVDIDLINDPLGVDQNGNAVYLKEIWPHDQEILELAESASNPETFKKMYKDVNSFNPEWNKISTSEGDLYQWQKESTYIQEPPFFTDLEPEAKPISPIENARVLVYLGDSVTTDHISPAGAIPEESPAGRYLRNHGVEFKDFNSFGSRRGNDQVMVRGTFGNIRLKNKLAPGTEGGVTRHIPDGEQMWIYDAAQKYEQEKVPCIVLAGKEYGTGSSRDWAAKGTLLLGIKAVIAESFERIHRSNLVGMGVLPLEFKKGDSVQSLGLDGTEKYTLQIDDTLVPQQLIDVIARSNDGLEKKFQVKTRIDSPIEVTYYRNGGILQTVLRQMLPASTQNQTGPSI
ncbi:aconitate hydratase AcnA [candidate division KSB1 bacterium]|nr:aconitate hydratase AcnA [candidate division KSB1 bacterium]